MGDKVSAYRPRWVPSSNMKKVEDVEEVVEVASVMKVEYGVLKACDALYYVTKEKSSHTECMESVSYTSSMIDNRKKVVEVAAVMEIEVE